jgi:phosphatidylserine/phosphatidylglycerophosphate/cardiolipin synthase-like enzyme
MRFKSKKIDNYCIYAVAGTNSVSFGIDASKANTKGLLGFSVKKTYPDGEHYLPGFKVFQSHKEKVKNAHTVVSTETDPVQSFVWDDFSLKAGETYTYTFIPVKGKPDALVQGKPIVIKIQTEPAFSKSVHDIFFNRGIASSQAYAREFNNTSPDKLVGKKQQDAFNWLSRDLYPALIKFIQQPKKGETILGCFYEFNYLPVLQELKKAIDRGVNVKLVIDAKMNGKEGKSNTPRDQSLATIKKAGITMKHIILREANKNKLQHNKFMVYVKGPAKKAAEVWTGSTNITESGIFGQTNVGHWVKDAATAKLYQEYWTLLSKDPGAKDADSAADKKKDLANYKKAVVAIQRDIDKEIPKGITPIFSPRSTVDMLGKYFSLMDNAQKSGAITLAFGITADLKDLLIQHTKKSPVIFMMLEKPDKPNPKSSKPFVPLTSKNNVYEAFGAYLENSVYEWVKETNMKNLGITSFVNYIHSKFLIQDALGSDPIVITGSANFSPPSTTDNDENMILIRGDKRVADIYFTEFNRLFNHYYFRAIVKQLKDKKVKDDAKSYFLSETDEWIKNYKAGSLRQKRVQMFIDMDKPVILS